MPISTLRGITTFDAIVDVDFGLVRLVLDEFNNPDYLIPSIEKLTKDFSTLRVLLADREIENPLSVIFRKEYRDSIDDLREELIDQYYPEILSLSGETSVSRIAVATAANKQNVTETYVLCKSDIEINHIQKLDTRLKPLLFKGDELVSNDYHVFYLKRFSDIALFEPIRGHNLFIMEYKFNLDPPLADGTILPKDEYLRQVGEYNGIYTLPAYPGLNALDLF